MTLWRVPASPLTGGVSRQPDPIRDPNMLEDADNCNLFIHRGLEKRYGTYYVQGPDNADGTLNLTGSASTRWYCHWIEQDADKRFVVMIDDQQASDANIIQVFNHLGDKMTVTITDADALAYIKSGSGDSKDNLRIITVGSNTFIVNKTVTTALTGSAPSYANITAQSQLKFPNDDFTVTAGEWDVGDYINLVSAQVGYPVGVYEIVASPLDAGDQEGPWYSRVPPAEANNSIDPATFPVKLVYDGSTTFSLELIDWNDRLSGDAVTNPGPDFIGKTVQDITIFEDRLWFLAGEFVFASQAGDLFNLWVDDWTNITDSDPIDFPLTGTDIHKGQFIIPFSKTLVIMADGGKQYEVQSAGDFSPSATNLIATTAYRSSSKAYPAKMGQQLYFASEQGDYSYLWEYFYNFDYDANIGNNIAQHIEEYLPSNIDRIVTSENNGLVLCSSEDEPNVIYTLFIYWNATQKAQNAWGRWVFDSDITILSYQPIGTDLYLLCKEGSKVWLEYMPIATPLPETDANGSLDFRLHLDRKVSLVGSYSAGVTTFTLPFVDDNIDTVVLGAGFTTRKGQQITATNDSSGANTLIRVNGNISAYACFVGKSYNMSATLSRVYPKDQNNQTIFGAFQLLFMDLYMRNTTTLDVTVTPNGRAAKVRRFFANRIGSAILGRTGVEDSARMRVHIRGKGDTTSIVLSNNTPFQSEVTNMEFTGDLQAGAYNPTR